MAPRSMPEWVGRTPDAAIPPRVALRVLDRQRPKPNALPVCPICGMPIREGDGCDLDHAMPLADGGEHREANIRAVHRGCHKLKTAREALERAERRTRQKKTYGFAKAKRPLRSRGFDRAEPQHTATRPLNRKSESAS